MSRDTGGSVILVPVDQQNFEDTVSTPIELGEYDDSPEAFQSLGRTRLWGVEGSDRSIKVVDRMEHDDLVIFYRDNRWIGVGRVGKTFVDEDRWIAQTFWTGKPATHLFTIVQFSPLSIPREAANTIFGYKPGYVPRGITRVAQKRVTNSIPAIELALKRYDRSLE